MPRFVTVTHDSARDFVHIRYKSTTLETADDVAEFAREVSTQIIALVGDRKVDIVIDLGNMSVKPLVARGYDEARLELVARHARSAHRYSGSAIVRTKILTSSTLHNQRANVHESFEQAVAALLASRGAS